MSAEHVNQGPVGRSDVSPQEEHRLAGLDDASAHDALCPTRHGSQEREVQVHGGMIAGKDGTRVKARQRVNEGAGRAAMQCPSVIAYRVRGDEWPVQGPIFFVVPYLIQPNFASFEEAAIEGIISTSDNASKLPKSVLGV